MQPPEYLELAKDHDMWRDRYDQLTFDDHKQVYRHIRELFPNQRSFTLQRAYPFFDRYRPTTVIELGGWDGFLAACVLGQHPEIVQWLSYELAEVPQSCVDSRYWSLILDEPFWDRSHHADCFVATHTIEHIKAWELAKLVASIDVRCCLIEAPIDATPTDWAGHPSTHVLEVGWREVDKIFAVAGFEIHDAWRHGRYYSQP